MERQPLLDDSVVDHLKHLDREQRFAELSQVLQQLPEDGADPQQGVVAFFRGKLAVEAGRDDEAVQQLCKAVQALPGNASSHCLLGMALLHQKQWLDARHALSQALRLQPSLAEARLSLATVLLSLGEPEPVLALIEPLPDTPIGPLRSIRAKAAVFMAANQLKAASVGAAALAQDSRLADATLLAWMAMAGGLLLSDRVAEGRGWLIALTTLTPAQAAIQNPFPRRTALLALLALELIHPSLDGAQSLILELRNLRWLPPSGSEHQIWKRWLEVFLHRVAAQLEEAVDRDQARCTLLLKPIVEGLEAIRPPNHDDGGLGFRLELLRQGCQPPLPPTQQEQLLVGLQRHGRGWSTLTRLLQQCCELDDRCLRALRPELERQLDQFSATVLSQPRLLRSLPDADFAGLARQQCHEGLALISRCRARLAALTQPLPEHTRVRRHWLLLASDDLPQCFLYRVEQKQQQLERQGCRVRVVMRDELNNGLWTEALLWADAVIVCRLPATNQVLRAIDLAHQAGLPTWYDVDDLVFDPEHGTPALETYGGTISPELHRGLQLDVPLFATAMRACRSAIVSTSTLARRWQQLHTDQPVELLPNLAPPELRAARRAPGRISRRPRLVVASGTKAHKQVWMEELAPALAQLLSRHPSLNVDLVGHIQLPVVLRGYAERVHCYPFSDYATYLQRLKQADIGLVALEPGLYTDAKSAIRWMEFSYLGLASVLSPTATYTEILQDGIHARFARGMEQWVATVEQLLADPRETRAMAGRAQQRAKDLFDPQQARLFWQSLTLAPDQLVNAKVLAWKQPLLQALHATFGSGTLQTRRRKLLVLNVFFAPQSVGGATRIAQDQVRSVTQNLEGEWDVTVLCTDPTPWMNGVNPDKPLVEVHQWQGARVVRLSVPPKDWSGFHEWSIELFCLPWFKQEQFDLIHVHCIQVIGVGPLSVARHLRIPYAITLHDGWWLSPRQFLTKVSGRPVDLQDAFGHLDGNAKASLDPAVQDSLLNRHRTLRRILADASARWAVSESFAQLHREAGIADVGVMENVWQPMVPQQPRGQCPADQPLRCCFIGGIALHKGMATLQAAVVQARPNAPGLVLTIMDSTLAEGELNVMTWGETAVQFVPPVPMGQMSDFYQQQDVLIAPSIWPESFGLVTREALSAGLWVVASDIGALADPIRHGENGHRVPAGDAGALARVLEQLSDQHPHPQPLLSFQNGRAALHQELRDRYQDILAS